MPEPFEWPIAWLSAGSWTAPVCKGVLARLLMVVAAAGCCCGGSAAAVERSAERDVSDRGGVAVAESPTKWIRIVRGQDQTPQSLQTSMVRYVSKSPKLRGVEVELVGAIHIADREYYELLNRQFERYEVVLYELVAPPGTRVPRGREPSSGHPVGAIQNLAKDVLGLEHQLARIDYTKANFVHADMSPDQLSRAMEERGESLMQMVFRLMGQSMAQQSRRRSEGASADIDLFAALFARDRALRLKRLIVDQFEGLESMLVGLGGPEGTALIEGRNAVALEKLQEQIEAGKKRIAIFYGAGHLADMDSQLREEFRMAPVETRWLTAWNLQSAD